MGYSQASVASGNQAEARQNKHHQNNDKTNNGKKESYGIQSLGSYLKRSSPSNDVVVESRQINTS